MPNRIVWTVNRLRLMDVSEVVYRLQQAWQTRTEAFGLGLAGTPSLVSSSLGRAWLEPLPRTFEVQRYRDYADGILAGQFDVFSMHGMPLGFPPRWNRDPNTGIEAPLVMGKRLDYRNQALVGDIKSLWEPSRHLQLTSLAQAYHLTGEARYAEGIRTLLESWFKQCPYPFGPHWASSLELAIRLANWSFTWHLIGGQHSSLFSSEEGMRFKESWLNSIYRHCHFIAGHLSRHSSANNHLFGELSGLYIAALTWPCWKESDKWQAMAANELEQEAQRQNYSDGVNREQAIYYQHQVADMMLHCWLVGRANGTGLSPAFAVMLERLLEFIAAMMDYAGNVPSIGDADDGLFVKWSLRAEWSPYRSLLATGAALFDRPDFKRKAGQFDDKSRWLLGDTAAERYEWIENVSRPASRSSFPEGGYFVLGDGFDTSEEIKLVADAGPLGYLSLAAHGHADALAFTLSVGGNPFLIDPGTYAYHTREIWRSYFRGTAAHNTVRVDGVDQSEPGGNFMWLRKAQGLCEAWETNKEMDRFIGSHNGYRRLRDPVLHRREIEFDKAQREIRIRDTLICHGMHHVEFHWHFGANCKVETTADGVIATCGNAKVELGMPDTKKPPQLVIGQENPPLGWMSRRLGEKLPCPTLVWREKIQGTVSRITVIRVSFDPDATIHAKDRLAQPVNMQ
ncbi:MAG: heparinase II/III-like family protein [Herminiimonas sp.]|nr:heparinase II/III-like family protein [Herminiimonas sp.]